MRRENEVRIIEGSQVPGLAGNLSNPDALRYSIIARYNGRTPQLEQNNEQLNSKLNWTDLNSTEQDPEQYEATFDID